MKTPHVALFVLVLSTSGAAAAQDITPTPLPALRKHAGVGSAADAAAEPVEPTAADSAIDGQELMLNGFRAPSIGLEYRYGTLSLHAGAYPTVINDVGERGWGGATWFGKAGLTLWFLPVPLMGNERSSFYAGAAYLNDFTTRGWGHSAQIEAGFRWVIYQGLFLRLGLSLLYSPGRECQRDACTTVKLRPNPGLGIAIPLS